MDKCSALNLGTLLFYSSSVTRNPLCLSQQEFILGACVYFCDSQEAEGIWNICYHIVMKEKGSWGTEGDTELKMYLWGLKG